MSKTGSVAGMRSGHLPEGKRLRFAGFWATAALALAAGTWGCGEGTYQTGKTYPVKGKVVLADGKPLTSGRISFVSDKTALTYAATIAPEGTFEVKQDDRIGAPEGTYKVRVEMVESSLPKAKRKSQANLPYAGRFTDEDASKLTANVKPIDDNSFLFKLEKK